MLNYKHKITLGTLFMFFSIIPYLWADTAGIASWYSTEACKYNPDPKCPTASGRSLYELINEKVPYAAMWKVPFGTKVEVCNENKICETVIILDRGPSKSIIPHRIIDLNPSTFSKLGGLDNGLIKVNFRFKKSALERGEEN